jgi:hypothetical protein
MNLVHASYTHQLPLNTVAIIRIATMLVGCQYVNLSPTEKRIYAVLHELNELFIRDGYISAIAD